MESKEMQQQINLLVQEMVRKEVARNFSQRRNDNLISDDNSSIIQRQEGRPIEQLDYFRIKFNSLEASVKCGLFLELANDPDIRAKYEVFEKFLGNENDGKQADNNKQPEIKPRTKFFEKSTDDRQSDEMIEKTKNNQINVAEDVLDEEGQLQLAMAMSMADEEERKQEKVETKRNEPEVVANDELRHEINNLIKRILENGKAEEKPNEVRNEESDRQRDVLDEESQLQLAMAMSMADEEERKQKKVETEITEVKDEESVRPRDVFVFTGNSQNNDNQQDNRNNFDNRIEPERNQNFYHIELRESDNQQSQAEEIKPEEEEQAASENDTNNINDDRLYYQISDLFDDRYESVEDENELLQIQFAMALSLSETTARIDEPEAVQQEIQQEQGAAGGLIQEEPEENEEAGIRCPICFDNFEVDQIVTITGCEHVFCSDCTIGHLTAKINDGNIEHLVCPGEGCQQNIALEIIGRILPLDLLEKYENLMLRRTLTNFDNVHDCPQCGRQIECAIDIGMGECPHCEYSFCTSCMQAYHGSFDCQLSEEDRKQLIELFKRQESANAHRAAEEARRIIEEARRRREAEDQAASNFIRTNYKHCPDCRRDIEKSGGCNHMTCPCGTHFCYICGSRMNPDNPYVHFETGPCKDKTFDYPEEDEGMLEDN